MLFLIYYFIILINYKIKKQEVKIKTISIENYHKNHAVWPCHIKVTNNLVLIEKNAIEYPDFDNLVDDEDILLSIDSPSNLAEKMKNKELLILQKKEFEKEIEEINNDSEENVNKTKNIKYLNKAIKQQDEVIAQVQGNISLRDDVEKIKGICKNIKIDVKKLVKQKIIDDCNNELRKIFSGNKLLQIEDIEEYIIFKTDIFTSRSG